MTTAAGKRTQPHQGVSSLCQVSRRSTTRQTASRMRANTRKPSPSCGSCSAQDPDHPLAHLALAVLLGRVGQHDEAVAHGRKACELEPEEAFNFTALSVTFQRAFAGTGNRDYIRLAEESMAKANSLQHRQHMR